MSGRWIWLPFKRHKCPQTDRIWSVNHMATRTRITNRMVSRDDRKNLTVAGYLSKNLSCRLAENNVGAGYAHGGALHVPLCGA